MEGALTINGIIKEEEEITITDKILNIISVHNKWFLVNLVIPPLKVRLLPLACQIIKLLDLLEDVYNNSKD